MMYISSGLVVPIFVQYTCSRSPGVDGCELRARSFSSGCAMESLLTPVRVRMPRARPPPAATGGPERRAAAALPATAGLGRVGAVAEGGVVGVAGGRANCRCSYVMRSVFVQP